MTTHSANYSTTFLVDRTVQEVFDAINKVTEWWSQEVVGVTDRVGGEFTYHYQDAHRCVLRVTELAPGRRVVWHVVDNYFNFVQDQDEWKDTDIVFDITETSDGTEVCFTHAGLAPQFECYDVCSNAWAGYIDGSLRQLIITGQGQPNLKEGGTPEHQDAANEQRAKRSSATPNVSTAPLEKISTSDIRPEDEAAIQAVLADSYKGWAAGDADGMVANYTEDATAIMTGSLRAGRAVIRQNMALAFAGPLKDTSTYNKQLSIRFLGTDAAIVVTESGILFGSQTQVPDAEKVNGTWVLEKRDGQWLIAAYHNSPTYAPE